MDEKVMKVGMTSEDVFEKECVSWTLEQQWLEVAPMIAVVQFVAPKNAGEDGYFAVSLPLYENAAPTEFGLAHQLPEWDLLAAAVEGVAGDTHGKDEGLAETVVCRVFESSVVEGHPHSDSPRQEKNREGREKEVDHDEVGSGSRICRWKHSGLVARLL